MIRTGWWYRATQAEKLAQIDGCIEVGMTAKQCAMNVGTYEDEGSDADGRQRILAFATYHGRTFSEDEYKLDNKAAKVSRYHRKRANFSAAKQSYLAGEPVDFWSAE